MENHAKERVAIMGSVLGLLGLMSHAAGEALRTEDPVRVARYFRDAATLLRATRRTCLELAALLKQQQPAGDAGFGRDGTALIGPLVEMMGHLGAAASQVGRLRVEASPGEKADIWRAAGASWEAAAVCAEDVAQTVEMSGTVFCVHEDAGDAADPGTTAGGHLAGMN